MRNKELLFIKLGFFLLFLSSMYPWMTWRVGVLFSIVLSLLFSVPFFPRLFKYSKKWSITLFFVLLLAIWESTRLNYFGIIIRLVSILPVWVLTTFDDKTHKEILDFILKWFSIILGISLVTYILVKIGIPLPSSEISYSEMDGYDVFQNYYFCITKPLSFRFQSIFLEPGHMTMGIAPLLYLYRYNLRNKYVLILFLAQLFSLSLAGYLVMAAGFILQLLFDRDKKSKFSFKPVLLFSIIITALVIYLPKITAEEDIFDLALISRLDKYSETGFTRTSEDFDYLFDRVIASDNKWTGIPMDTSDLGGAGIKKYIVGYGIIGILLSFFLYLSPTLVFRKRSVFLFCFILLLLLAQNTYPSWFCALISLISGTTLLNMKGKGDRVYDNLYAQKLKIES